MGATEATVWPPRAMSGTMAAAEAASNDCGDRPPNTDMLRRMPSPNNGDETRLTCRRCE